MVEPFPRTGRRWRCPRSPVATVGGGSTQAPGTRTRSTVASRDASGRASGVLAEPQAAHRPGLPLQPAAEPEALDAKPPRLLDRVPPQPPGQGREKPSAAAHPQPPRQGNSGRRSPYGAAVSEEGVQGSGQAGGDRGLQVSHSPAHLRQPSCDERRYDETDGSSGKCRGDS